MSRMREYRQTAANYDDDDEPMHGGQRVQCAHQ